MSVSYSILVTGSPTKSQAHLSAIRFINAALKLGHQIKSVFFYQDAVHVANKFNIKPDDELQLTQEWIALSNQFQFELQVCVAASNRRAVISKEEAVQNKFESSSLAEGYTVLGLGQLAASLSKPTDSSFKQIHFK